jgi:hypothetical protein
MYGYVYPDTYKSEKLHSEERSNLPTFSCITPWIELNGAFWPLAYPTLCTYI